MTAPAPQPLPATHLSDLLGVRPPWSWSNLTEDEARDFDGALSAWVLQYNEQLTTDASHVIPACWRQHPALAQTLPVIYWAWWDAHRKAGAVVRGAVEFHGRHLPAFHARVNDLLGGPPNAAKCRGGRHEDGPGTDQARSTAAARAATDDPGPDVIDVLIGTSFGC